MTTLRSRPRVRSTLLALLGPLVWGVPWLVGGARFDVSAAALIVVLSAPYLYLAALTELEETLSVRHRAALVVALAGGAAEAAIATWGGYAAEWLVFLSPILLLTVAVIGGRPGARTVSGAE